MAGYPGMVVFLHIVSFEVCILFVLRVEAL